MRYGSATRRRGSVRLENDLPLTPYVRAAFWGGSEENYSDFPTYDVQQAGGQALEDEENAEVA